MGSQEPSVRIVPEYEYTDGPDAIAVCEAGGLILDPWQADLQYDWLGRNRYGRWTASICGISVPRQNGKTADIQGRSDYGMLILSEWVVYTAHLQKTATETFEEMANFFETGSMTKHVKEIKYALGREQILLKNGGRIKFLARTRNGGRGAHGDLLIFDEAQELTNAQQAAFLPAISASKNPQTLYLGTPPDETCDGSVFKRIRRDAISGKTRKTAWAEWSVPEIGDKHDRARWAATNPALGRRILITTVEGEAEQMDPDVFARERLGWWKDDDAVDGCFDPSEWDALKVDFTDEEIAEQASWKRAYGVKFSADGKRAAIAIAIWKRGATPHVEVLEHGSTENGIQWAEDWLTPRCGKVSTTVIDGKANALDLYNRLLAGGVVKRALDPAKPETVTAASSMFLNAVTEGSMTHIGQPALDDAVKAAEKREIGKGGGFGFQSGNETDITPLEAACLALWGVRTTKRDPSRKAVVG
jgi:hypothetical protein